MKKQLAFGSLLLATSQLVAPAALAQSTSPPTGSVVTPDATQQGTPPESLGPQDAPTEDIEISAPGAGDVQEDIVVIGRNIPNIVRATPQVVSVLSTADIARTGEGDIAGALTRVTGLSVVGNGFVFVRGLGDRYSSSLLNGSPLPSPEPLRRVVPLDIFPTNIVASALVQKSYSANYPGEFGGGAINLTTRAVPDETFLQVGGSVGFDTVSSSELGYVYDGGSADVFGYDDGERDVPAFIREAGLNSRSLTSAEASSLSNAPTTLLQEQAQLPANWSGEASFGTFVDVSGSTRIGLIASGGISNSFRTRAATQQVANSADGGLSSDFDTVTTDNRILVNGLFGLGAEIGEHRLRLTNVYVHDTLKQGILSAGDNEASGIPSPFGVPGLIEQYTNWFERQLFTTQFNGEFDFDPLKVEVRGSYANTKRKSPYERAFRYQYTDALGINDYINDLGGSPNRFGRVAFSDLNEDLYSGSIDLTYDLNLDRPLSISTGYAYTDSQRTASRYEFRYLGPNNASLPIEVAQLRPDYLLSDATINLYGITLQNNSTSQGAAAYDASLETNAGYVQVDAEVLDGIRATVGVRYEDASQSVVPTGGVTGTNLSNSYWLPASTITWNFAEDMQLRVHASKTIARPQFRELAPQIYQDFESNRQFIGNPLLVDSELYNLEARYEWFFGRDQRLTAAGFYKRIDNPIEAVASIAAGGGALQTGFSNAPSANLYGGEIEFQKYLPLDSLGSSFATARLLLLANYTYTQSSINASEALVPNPILNQPPVAANLLFRDGAPLVGQSDHLVNAQIGIEDEENRTQFTVLFNYASERVTNRGPVFDGQRLPDIVEEPGLRLDVVFRQGIAIGDKQSIDLKFEGRNLTKTRYQEYQIFPENVRVDTNTYDLGRIFTVGISATL
ncbi:TonB-dependent receptor [Sphingomonas sp. S1-29]|nr:TonB-dependent receptor [Sphingomonas sp. S1-29]